MGEIGARIRGEIVGELRWRGSVESFVGELRWRDLGRGIEADRLGSTERWEIWERWDRSPEGSTESVVESSVEGNRRERWETMRMISSREMEDFPNTEHSFPSL